MKLHASDFSSIGQVSDRFLASPEKPQAIPKETTVKSFRDILREKSGQQDVKNFSTESQLKFSRHAVNRLTDRNITLSEGQVERLENGAKRAGEKGISESLVLMDSMAFIVNVPNKTVITAMNQEETQDNIFTNIDGAVIV